MNFTRLLCFAGIFITYQKQKPPAYGGRTLFVARKTQPSSAKADFGGQAGLEVSFMFSTNLKFLRVSPRNRLLKIRFLPRASLRQPSHHEKQPR